MKKIITIILMLAMVLSVFAACDNGQTKEDTALADAAEYLKSINKGLLANPQTAADFTVPSQVIVNGKVFAVEWTTNTDAVKVSADAATKLVTISVGKPSEVINYELTATIKAEDGQTETLTFKLNVPKYNVNTWDDYARECAENDGDTVVIIGYVVAIVSATDSSSKGTIWVQDATGRGYYVYAPSLSSDVLASRESIQAAFPIGTEVEVSGTVTTYNGCLEFNKGCSVTKTGSTAADKGVELVYTDATADFGAAANNKDRATLDKYQSARVSIKGATLTKADGSYYYFTVNGVEYNLYKNNYFFEQAQIDELFAKFVAGTKVDITGVVSVYSNAFQIYPDTVDSIAPSDVQLTDAEKLEVELGNVTVEEMFSSDAVINLPLKGTSIEDVTFAWTLEETEHATFDATTGALIITVPVTEATISLKVVGTCGAETAEKTFELKLSKSITPISEALELEDDTKVLVLGKVTEIAEKDVWNEKYGNMSVTISDADGNSLYIYRLATKVELGDTILITGTMGSYKGVKQIVQGATAVIISHETVEEGTEESTVEGSETETEATA